MSFLRTLACATLIAAQAAALAACNWPADGTGGLAEREPAALPAFTEASATLDRLAVAGGDRYAAAEMVEARLLLVRAQREQAGGLHAEASSDLARLQASLARIELRLAPQPTPLAPRPVTE